MADIMGKMDIAFPNMGIYLENVPKNFTVFGFTIAFYGVIIGLAIIAGVLLVVHQAKVTGQDPDTYWDLAIYEIIFSVIGARIYYVLTSWNSFKDNLLSIFNLRTGGMAIYGAVIAAFITLALYCRIKKKSFLLLADTAVPGLVIGQVIGRFANFTNREVFGHYTDSFFAMRIPTEMVRTRDISTDIAEHMSEATNYIQVHPTFLYESMWNLALLIIILIYRKHKKFQGELTLMYLGGYGIGRFWIEAMRTDQLFIPGTQIPISQAVGVISVIIAIVGLTFGHIKSAKAKKNNVEEEKIVVEPQKEEVEEKKE